MPNYALQFNGSGYVDTPAKTAGSASTDTWTAIFDLEIPNTTDQAIYAATSTATTDYFRITGANTATWRIGAGTIQNLTLSQNFPIDTRFILGIYRESGRNLVITIDGAEVYRANAVAFGAGGNAISITSIGKASVGALSGLVYEATIQGSSYLNTTSATESTWGDGTLTGIPNTNWVEYGAGTTPISFTGSIANQVFTVGDTVNVDLSAGFSGTQTPFTFALTAGLLVGTGLTLSSAGVLSGTATESAVAGLVITGTDADLNVAASNAFSVTVTAAPAGNDTTVAFTMPQMSVAVSAGQAGVATFTSEPLKDLSGNLLDSEALDYVAFYDATTGDLVLRVTGLSTDASGIFTVENAALESGVTYKVDWKVTSQSAGRMPAKAAV
jgi:hypothetical protein